MLSRTAPLARLERAVASSSAAYKYDRTVPGTVEDFAYSGGDNPRGALQTLDGKNSTWLAMPIRPRTQAGGPAQGLTIGRPSRSSGLEEFPPSPPQLDYFASETVRRICDEPGQEHNWRGTGNLRDASVVQNLYMSSRAARAGIDAAYFQVLNGTFPNAPWLRS